MYTIYVRHFRPPRGYAGTMPSSGYIETETLLCRIPAEFPDSEMIVNPKVKAEMGKAGSFEFEMEENNIWYSSFSRMTTIVRVDYDEETIFYGRVLNADNPDMWGKRKVHCEGSLAFLLDTMMEPVEEKKREKITLASYIQYLIDSHNSLVADEMCKRFHLGQVPGKYTEDIPESMRIPNETKKYGTGNWTSTLNCLEELTSQHGGYWRVRREMQDYTDTIGQYGMGNIDLNNRVVIRRDDGSVLTENAFIYQKNYGEDDAPSYKYILLPSIIGGVIFTKDNAIQWYNDRNEYLGIFDKEFDASLYMEALYDRQQWYYTGRGQVERFLLDWFRDMFDANVINQPLKLTENIINMASTVDVNGIFTVLIPEGTKNGKPLYLDEVPKSVTKESLGPKPKRPSQGGDWSTVDNPEEPTPDPHVVV